MSLIEEYSKWYRNTLDELYGIKLEMKGVLKSIMQRAGAKNFAIETPSSIETTEPWLFAEIYYNQNLAAKLDIWGEILVYNPDSTSTHLCELEKGIEQLIKMYNV